MDKVGLDGGAYPLVAHSRSSGGVDSPTPHELPARRAVSFGNTIEDVPYDVDPPWFDMEIWNRQYTYKDSSSYPSGDFETGGDYESPYAGETGFPTAYDAGYHMDAASSTNPGIGEFNGALIAPVNITSNSTHYTMTFASTELVGPGSDLCVEATATDASGNSATTWSSGCP